MRDGHDPRVSVLIPTFNYGRFLSRAIDSVLAQSVKPLEVVVADDGSTDNTAEVVAAYGDAVTYRRFDHVGVYAIRQAMLQELHGEWFLNLDADNWIEPGFLARALDMVSRHSGDGKLAFVYPDIQRFGEVEEAVVWPDFDVQRLKLGSYLDMNALILLRAARETGFDARFNDGQGDYDFFLSLVEKGYRGVRLPGGFMHVRIHAASISGEGRQRFRHVELAERILAKHASFFSSRETRTFLAEARRRMNQAIWQRAASQHDAGRMDEAAALARQLLRADAGAYALRAVCLQGLIAMFRLSRGRMRLTLIQRPHT